MAAPAQAELLVQISKSQQRLSVLVNGAEAFRWPVSTGRKGYTTPSGTYRPTRLERHWYSRKYDMAPMPWSVFFHRGYAVHGTMEAYNLGRAASHGCVRLRPDNASILFSMVKRYGANHTKLVVMDGPLPRAPHPVGQPMVEGPAVRHMAKADLAEADLAEDAAPARRAAPVVAAASEHLSAKTHAAAVAHEAEPAPKLAPKSVAKPAVRIQMASAERLSSSAGNEAQVLRERAAWLKAIDRKYGITH
jgi:hypothetical protein